MTGKIKAKPLAFLVGLVLLSVSIYGFLETDTDRLDRPLLHSLSVVGLIVSSILVAYGLIPRLQVGAEGEMAETVGALGRGIKRLILPLLVLGVLGGLSAGGYFAYGKWIAEDEATTSARPAATRNAAPTAPSNSRPPSNSSLQRLLERVRLRTSPWELGTARVASGTGERRGYSQLVECAPNYSRAFDSGTRVEIVSIASQCSVHWYKVRTSSDTFYWFTHDDLAQ